jgi:phosphatidylinositol alpha-mannosyltransferase
LSFIGRMDEPRKGLDTLLTALPQIRASFADLEVVIAGEGRRSLPPGCRTLGVVSDREKSELLATSDVFVAPHVARESFGIVLLEAMASGTPVVASDLPAFADILAPVGRSRMRQLGVTFPVGDADALAGAVVGVLTHPDPVRTEAARQATRAYDWGNVGAAIAEVYRATWAVGRPARKGMRTR